MNGGRRLTTTMKGSKDKDKCGTVKERCEVSRKGNMSCGT
jgi:hypothetical protein